MHPLSLRMSVRQRLPVAIDSRRANKICWRCALRLQRPISTSRILGVEQPSKGDLAASFKFRTLREVLGPSQTPGLEALPKQLPEQPRKDSKPHLLRAKQTGGDEDRARPKMRLIKFRHHDRGRPLVRRHHTENNLRIRKHGALANRKSSFSTGPVPKDFMLQEQPPRPSSPFPQIKFMPSGSLIRFHESGLGSGPRSRVQSLRISGLSGEAGDERLMSVESGKGRLIRFHESTLGSGPRLRVQSLRISEPSGEVGDEKLLNVESGKGRLLIHKYHSEKGQIDDSQDGVLKYDVEYDLASGEDAPLIHKSIRIAKHRKSSVLGSFERFMAEKYGITVRTHVGGAASGIRKFTSSDGENVYVSQSDDATYVMREGTPSLEGLERQGIEDNRMQIRKHAVKGNPRDAVFVSKARANEPQEQQDDNEEFYQELDSVLSAFKEQFPSGFDRRSSGSPWLTRERRRETYSSHIGPAAGGSRTSIPSGKISSVSTMVNQSRGYATTSPQAFAVDRHIDQAIAGADSALTSPTGSRDIKKHLKLWQEQQDSRPESIKSSSPSLGSTSSGLQNVLTQSGEDENFTQISRDDEVDDDDHVSFGSDEPTLDIFRNQMFLRRGDMVELSTGIESLLAIFIRSIDGQHQFYTIRGEWVVRNESFSKFAVPQFVHPHELNDILPFLPSSQVAKDKLDLLQPMDTAAPRGAGAKVIEKMTVFYRAADNVFRNYADRLNRVYEIIAPSKLTAGRTQQDLREIAMKVLQKKDAADLTQAMMLAVHRVLMQTQNVKYDSMNYRQNPVYEIFPQESLEYISQVREWVREFQEAVIEDATEPFNIGIAPKKAKCSQNPIATLVKKARIAIEQSRHTRSLSASGNLGPSSVKVVPVEPRMQVYRETWGKTFDENERIIIHYLYSWTTSRTINKYTNFDSVGPMILRAVGMYDGFDLTEVIGYTFLQELGILSPWENRTAYSIRNMTLPDHDEGYERVTQLSAKARTFLEHFVPQDSMKALRKDWGDLPVFCIDSAETLERDDGVSVQPIDDDPSLFWVHIHVANPSAFVTPESPVAKYAAQLSESVYFPERKYPMLHPPFTEKYLSLDRNRPCITFSAKVSTDGTVLERQISHGTVHNVLYVTPETVGRGLGISDESETTSLLTVGGTLPSAPRDHRDEADQELSESHVSMLRRLLELGVAIRRKRVEAGAPDFYLSARIKATYPQVYLSKTVAAAPKVRDTRIQTYEGDPIISLQSYTEGYSLVAKMVSDLMVLAGEIGATWCKDRNIPVPYRGIMRNPEPASSPEKFKKEVIDPKVAKYGHADQSSLIRYMSYLGQTAASATPLEHHALGLPAYCKTTSPLRRHVDMYTHWQIEAAIRHEAETGTSLIGSTDDTYLPFSRSQVEEYASTTRHRERKISVAKTCSSRHWITQALFRAFYFKEAPLPDTFEVQAMFSSKNYQQGWMIDWNVKVDIVTTVPAVVAQGGVQPGDVWEARIQSISTYYRIAKVEPIRLIERELQEDT